MLSSNPFSAHKDVLEALIPADSIGRTVLLTEVKNRAKAAVGAGQWPDAKSLYEKAIAICDASQDTAESAICQSNLSLVLGKMNQWADAKQAALLATQQDASYTKGFWRLGSACAALKEYSTALQALQTAKTKEPDNKALQKEIQRIQQQQQQEQQTQMETSAVPASSAPKTTPAPPRSQLAKPSSNTTKASTSSTPSSSAPMDLDATTDQEHFTKSEITRGYKIVNGKKTSYFHNELDEHTKQLIGDIAPKKLDPTSTGSSSSQDPATSDIDNNTLTSAWNTAGTWEERDISQWACDALTQALIKASHIYDNCQVSVPKADVTGSASVAMVRGKKRYIYELAATIHWQAAAAGDSNFIMAKGTMTFPDIDGTCMVGEPYEVADFKIESSNTESGKTTADANTLHNIVCKTGLREELHKAIDGWVHLLKETY